VRCAGAGHVCLGRGERGKQAQAKHLPSASAARTRPEGAAPRASTAASGPAAVALVRNPSSLCSPSKYAMFIRTRKPREGFYFAKGKKSKHADLFDVILACLHVLLAHVEATDVPGLVPLPYPATIKT
jgi:hypothetical protein